MTKYQKYDEIVEFWNNISRFYGILKNRILSLSKKDQKVIANTLFNMKRKKFIKTIKTSLSDRDKITNKLVKRAKFLGNINFETICFMYVDFDWDLSEIFNIFPQNSIKN